MYSFQYKYCWRSFVFNLWLSFLHCWRYSEKKFTKISVNLGILPSNFMWGHFRIRPIFNKVRTGCSFLEIALLYGIKRMHRVPSHASQHLRVELISTRYWGGKKLNKFRKGLDKFKDCSCVIVWWDNSSDATSSLEIP